MQKFCVNCGTEINPNNKFCGNCGAATSNDVNKDVVLSPRIIDDNRDNNPKRSIIGDLLKLSMIIGIGGIILLVMFSGGLSGKDGSKDKEISNYVPVAKITMTSYETVPKTSISSGCYFDCSVSLSNTGGKGGTAYITARSENGVKISDHQFYIGSNSHITKNFRVDSSCGDGSIYLELTN